MLVCFSPERHVAPPPLQYLVWLRAGYLAQAVEHRLLELNYSAGFTLTEMRNDSLMVFIGHGDHFRVPRSASRIPLSAIRTPSKRSFTLLSDDTNSWAIKTIYQ